MQNFFGIDLDALVLMMGHSVARNFIKNAPGVDPQAAATITRVLRVFERHGIRADEAIAIISELGKVIEDEQKGT
jgi:hypothetical protein